MRSILKLVGVVSCGFLLCLGLSPAAQAGTTPLAEDDIISTQPEKSGRQADQKEMIVEMQSTHIIQGDVVRVEGTNYVVKRLDGREVKLHTNRNTMKTENINPGDRIEAKVNSQNTALSIFPAP